MSRPKTPDAAPKAKIKSDVAKKAWRKLRMFVKFWSFPKLFYKREYRKITLLREIILRFETAHWKESIDKIQKLGLVLAPKSLRAIWYDSSNFNLVFDESILDSYLLPSEASSEQVFIDATQDRAENVHVSLLHYAKVSNSFRRRFFQQSRSSVRTSQLKLCLQLCLIC